MNTLQSRIVGLVMLIAVCGYAQEVVDRGSTKEQLASIRQREVAIKMLQEREVPFEGVWVQEDGSFGVSVTTNAISLGRFANLPISELHIIINSAITNLAPIRTLPLKKLLIRGAVIRDLGPLHGMKIEELFLQGSEIDDFSPLTGLPLRRFTSNGAWFKDLSCVRGMPLEYLDICYTGITDLSALQGTPLRHITFSPESITNGFETLRQIKSLESVDVRGVVMTAKEFWRQFDAGEFKERAEPNAGGNAR